LDRGATLPQPHVSVPTIVQKKNIFELSLSIFFSKDVKCSCDDCIQKTSEDSLRHSLARVSEYRALASPSLIALSSIDPIQTAFQVCFLLVPQNNISEKSENIFVLLVTRNFLVHHSLTQLSWELRNLAFAEQESKADYLELRMQCQQFAVDLLDQTRSSQELAIILNYDPQSPPYMDGDHMKLKRLEMAIDYKQKKV
jgi:transient-receptor-potential-like protein